MAKPYDIVEMVGERDEKTGKWSKEYAITFDGIQWGPIGTPRDPDGSADFTCSTREEAIRMAEEANKALI
jgi:hypothetical protein